MDILDFIKDVGVNLISHYIINKKVAKSKVNETSTPVVIDTGEKPMPYRKQVAVRLLDTIDLLSLNYNKIQLSEISHQLDFLPVSLIEDYFRGEIEPSKKFIEEYAEHYGLNVNWLRHGKGQKFVKYDKFPIYPEAYRQDIDTLEPEQIFFVRSTGENGEAGILLKMTSTKFIVLPRTYYLSSNVGATGQLQIESFYELIKKISAAHYSINGLLLSNIEFSSLFQGEVYAGKVLSDHKQCSYWWDDFLDINHECSISNEYELLYGAEFVEAQNTVRYMQGRKYTL